MLCAITFESAVLVGQKDGTHWKVEKLGKSHIRLLVKLSSDFTGEIAVEFAEKATSEEVVSLANWYKPFLPKIATTEPVFKMATKVENVQLASTNDNVVPIEKAKTG